MSNPYAPIFILLALGFGFAALSVGTSLVVGPSATTAPSWRPTSTASSPRPAPPVVAASRSSTSPTAMLFIIFDIESIFLYPFAVAFDSLGLFALVEMVLFILTVFVAYAYVWKRGGLEWD